MKIIQVLPELNSGGVERGTLELSRFLVQQGHESLVISNGGRLVETLEAEGGTHLTLPVHRKSLTSLPQILKLRSLFQEQRPDVVHIRSRLPAWLVWLAWRGMDPATRPRLISTVHGFYSVNRYSRIMTEGEQVICVSRSVKDYVLKNYSGVPESKLRVVHRGVDPTELPYGFQPDAEWLECWRAEFPQLDGKYVIALPGRITRWKGHLDFVTVIENLRQKGLPVCGLIVGESHAKKREFEQELRDAIQLRGLESSIVFTGHRSDVREVMAVSDVVVSCSTDPEAFGRVTLEALSLGKPVAAYNHGGVAEQLEELMPEGRVPLRDIAAMTSLLARWYSDRPAPLRTTDHSFTLERFWNSVLSVYEDSVLRRAA
jgi:glycosyltransferase involved in cell wall biosynthesis